MQPQANPMSHHTSHNVSKQGTSARVDVKRPSSPFLSRGHNRSRQETHEPLLGPTGNDHKHDPRVVHKAIIDLYLEVKVRTWSEIDRLSDHQLKKERERLLSFDSLTVLDYIKTSIEILM